MASNAVQAQGTTLKIENSTSGAKTITGLTATNPMVLTSTSHGLSNGDVVTAALFAGASAALINANQYVVHHVLTNTFAIDFDNVTNTVTHNTGTATMTPVTWTTIGELKTISGFDGSGNEIDVTNLASTAKEFSMGLEDFGSLSMELNQYNDDAGQTAIRAAKTAADIKSWKLTLPNSDIATFSAYVKTFTMNLGVDGVVTGSVSLRVTGAVTWA